MMNRNEKLEIAKRLRLSTESELSRDDLEQMTGCDHDCTVIGKLWKHC